MSFANQLIDFKAVPKNEVQDAYHLSVACVHGINYLLTDVTQGASKFHRFLMWLFTENPYRG